MSRSIVVVGTGMFSQGFVSELVARSDGNARITIVDEKLEIPLNKALVQSFLAGKRGVEDCLFHSQRWFDKHNVALILGCSIRAIDQEQKILDLSNGDSLHFDELVVSLPRQVPVPFVEAGADDFVSGLDTVSELERLSSQLCSSRKVAVIGGGLAGIETALTLSSRGVIVELITGNSQLVAHLLDSTHAQLLKLKLEQLGISVRTASEVRSVILQRVANEEEIVGVSFDGGESTYSDMVIVTDETANFDAEWEQGVELARASLGGASIRPVNSEVNRISSPLLSVAIYSKVSERTEESEVIELDNRAKESFKRFEVSKGSLVRAVVIGDDAAVGRLSTALATRYPLIDASHLLFGDRGSNAMAGLVASGDIVCMCNMVSKARILEVALEAASVMTSECISRVVGETRATTGCGGCNEMVARVVEEVTCGQSLSAEMGTRQLATIGN